MKFGEVMVYAMFIIPAILGGMYALKGKALSATETTCQYCYKTINVAAKVCPYCRRSGPVAFSDRNMKKAWRNTPKARFIIAYVVILIAEIILLGVIGSLFR